MPPSEAEIGEADRTDQGPFAIHGAQGSVLRACLIPRHFKRDFAGVSERAKIVRQVRPFVVFDHAIANQMKVVKRHGRNDWNFGSEPDHFPGF